MIKPLVDSIQVFQMWLENSQTFDPMALNTECHCETVKTIDQSTVWIHGPLLEFQKTVKNTKLH